MCGKRSQWLGPIRRKREFASETGGTPRPTMRKVEGEVKGFARGARTRRN